MTSFSVEAMVRGYHVSLPRDMDAAVGEVLTCQSSMSMAHLYTEVHAGPEA